MPTRTQYSLIDDPTSPSSYAVRITEGDYVGVIFRFDNITITKMKKTAKISYTYSVLVDKHGAVTDKDAFEEFTSSILDDIIQNTEYRENYIGYTTSDPQKHSIFRKLLQAGYSIFENRIFRKRNKNNLPNDM